jgi:hypothetical protein
VEITLEDVYLAIRILNEFQKASLEAQRVLRRLGVRQSSQTFSPFSYQEIMKTLMESSLKGKIPQGMETEEEETKPLSQEELEKFREIAKKIKEKETKTT